MFLTLGSHGKIESILTVNLRSEFVFISPMNNQGDYYNISKFHSSSEIETC